MIDLQSHSTVSDGELPPGEVVAAAAKAGITTLALTDHDAVDGIAEADAAAKDEGIALVPAAEMSCIHASIDDLHMLGYWIDPAAMRPACERAQEERVTRAREIVEKLNSLGVEVSFEDAIAAGGRRLLGRQAAHRQGGRDASRTRWAPSSRSTWSRARRRSSRAAGRLPRRRSSLIHEAGGAAVLAHPFWDMDEPNAVAALIDDLALDGRRVLLPLARPRPDQVPAGALRGQGPCGDRLL